MESCSHDLSELGGLCLEEYVRALDEVPNWRAVAFGGSRNRGGWDFVVSGMLEEIKPFIVQIFSLYKLHPQRVEGAFNEAMNAQLPQERLLPDAQARIRWRVQRALEESQIRITKVDGLAEEAQCLKLEMVISSSPGAFGRRDLIHELRLYLRLKSDSQSRWWHVDVATHGADAERALRRMPANSEIFVGPLDLESGSWDSTKFDRWIKEDAAMRATVGKARRKQGACALCGKPMNVLRRMLLQSKHSECIEFTR